LEIRCNFLFALLVTAIVALEEFLNLLIGYVSREFSGRRDSASAVIPFGFFVQWQRIHWHTKGAVLQLFGY